MIQCPIAPGRKNMIVWLATGLSAVITFSQTVLGKVLEKEKSPTCKCVRGNCSSFGVVLSIVFAVFSPV